MQYYEGEPDFPEGAVYYLEGERAAERLVRCDFPDGVVYCIEGEKRTQLCECERHADKRLLRSEFPYGKARTAGAQKEPRPGRNAAVQFRVPTVLLYLNTLGRV